MRLPPRFPVKTHHNAVYSARKAHYYGIYNGQRHQWRVKLRVSRSLTIKQMAMVSAVSVVFIFVFVVTLLFHFAQSNRYHTAMQMESVARSVRQPLSAAILKADIPEAEAILQQIKPAGIIGRADVVLPNQFQALRVRFLPERPVPMMIARIFELPVQISLPLYSLERPANPQPLAYLVLQADSWRVYKYLLHLLSTLLTAWLLLSLILSVAISWCVNRLIVHPLRDIARELNDLGAEKVLFHQLKLPRLHKDDEIALLVRSYNRNQQTLVRLQEETTALSTHSPVTGLPNRALLMSTLEQVVASGKTTALVFIACETLQDATAVLSEDDRNAVLLAVAERMRSVISSRMTLAQVSHYDFAIVAHGVKEPGHALTLAQQLLAVLNEKLPVGDVSLRPTASIGIALFQRDLSAQDLYRRAVAAAFSARRKGKNQVLFFDPEQVAEAQRRLTAESDILTALENHHYAVWLQPQVDMQRGAVTGAEVLLRQQREDGSWTLPEGLIDTIEASGLMVVVGNWVLEESCRLLASWQSRGNMTPLSVNLSALQLLHRETAHGLLERLRHYRIAPGTLVLEVTESRHIDDPEAAASLLRPLRDAGVRIALDDFGMGYASLRQLHHMKAVPVDCLKIDKNFIDGLPEDSAMAAGIISLAKSLNLSVVAEGVETEAQRDWLLAQGVTLAQGYLFGKAVTPQAFEALYFPSAAAEKK